MDIINGRQMFTADLFNTWTEFAFAEGTEMNLLTQVDLLDTVRKTCEQFHTLETT